ncbi:MAG: sensor histidine kinase [Nanoarchaeota archaeon]
MAIIATAAYLPLIVVLLSIIIFLLIFFAFAERSQSRRNLRKFHLISRVTAEMRKSKSLRAAFSGILAMLIHTVPDIEGGFLVIFGRQMNSFRINVSHNVDKDKLRGFRFTGMLNNKILKQGPQRVQTNDFYDTSGKRYPTVILFPLVVRQHMIGAIGVGIRGKRLTNIDYGFMQIVAGSISLEYEGKLLQRKLEVFSEGLSLVEYSYENIVDNLPSGVVAIDTSGSILLFNKMMSDIIDVEEPLGREYVELFSNGTGYKKIGEFIKKLQDQQKILRIDELVLKKEGVSRVLRITGYPLTDTRGEVIAYIIIHYDVTQEHFLNQQLRDTQERAKRQLEQKVRMATSELVDANKELMRLNKVKSEFVSIISHELRTPLTSIKGYIQLILSGKLGTINDKQKDSLHIVSEESDRLARLINDVLDLSKLESGKSTLNITKVDMHELVMQVQQIIAPQADKKDIELSSNCEDTSMCRRKVAADAEKLKQVLINLLNNAVKFTPEGGDVRLNILDKKDKVRIEVIDTGIGISSEDVAHLFDPFYQVEEHLTRNAQGSGLGLAITKHIVDLHHGSIDIKSTVGKGTTITVAIPTDLEERT